MIPRVLYPEDDQFNPWLLLVRSLCHKQINFSFFVEHSMNADL